MIRVLNIEIISILVLKENGVKKTKSLMFVTDMTSRKVKKVKTPTRSLP